MRTRFALALLMLLPVRALADEQKDFLVPTAPLDTLVVENLIRRSNNVHSTTCGIDTFYAAQLLRDGKRYVTYQNTEGNNVTLVAEPSKPTLMLVEQSGNRNLYADDIKIEPGARQQEIVGEMVKLSTNMIANCDTLFLPMLDAEAKLDPKANENPTISVIRKTRDTDVFVSRLVPQPPASRISPPDRQRLAKAGGFFVP